MRRKAQPRLPSTRNTRPHNNNNKPAVVATKRRPTTLNQRFENLDPASKKLRLNAQRALIQKPSQKKNTQPSLNLPTPITQYRSAAGIIKTNHRNQSRAAANAIGTRTNAPSVAGRRPPHARVQQRSASGRPLGSQRRATTSLVNTKVAGTIQARGRTVKQRNASSVRGGRISTVGRGVSKNNRMTNRRQSITRIVETVRPDVAQGGAAALGIRTSTSQRVTSGRAARSAISQEELDKDILDYRANAVADDAVKEAEAALAEAGVEGDAAAAQAAEAMHL